MKTNLFKITSPDDERLKIVGEALRNGEIAAIPTETVYGLAASALNPAAVEKIYVAKGRPGDNPLIVHISRLEQWNVLVRRMDNRALKLAKAFWPGPLTIILEKSDIVPLEVTGGLDTVAVRMPSHPIARAVIDCAGVPLAAPSANISGKPSPTCAEHVLDDLDGKVPYIIDGGECDVGVESTVITLKGETPRLLRPGAITVEMLKSVIGEIEVDKAVYNRLQDGQTAASPGMKYKHYSPNASVVLIKGDFERYRQYLKNADTKNAAALCFDEDAKALNDIDVITFGSEKDPLQQANRIFDALRTADKKGYGKVYARYPKTDGVGLAVFNRLIRAAGFNVV